MAKLPSYSVDFDKTTFSLFVPDWARRAVRSSSGQLSNAPTEDQEMLKYYGSAVLGITSELSFEKAAETYFNKQIDGIEDALKEAGILGAEEKLDDDQREAIKANIVAKMDDEAVRQERKNELTSLNNALNSTDKEIITLSKEIKQLDALAAKGKLSKTEIKEAKALDASIKSQDPDKLEQAKQYSETLKQRDKQERLLELNGLAQEAQAFDKAIPGSTPVYTPVALVRDHAQQTRDNMLRYAKVDLSADLLPDNLKIKVPDAQKPALNDALKQKQQEAEATLTQEINSSINNLDAAIREEQRRTKTAIRAFGEISAESIGASSKEIDALRVALSKKNVHGIQHRKVQMADGRTEEVLCPLKSRSGLDITASEGDNGEVRFSMQMPNNWLSAGYYHGSDHSRKDVRNLAELVKATGAKGIQYNISGKSDRTNKLLARQAYEEAIVAGFDPKDIEIKIGGSKISYNDLFQRGDDNNKKGVKPISETGMQRRGTKQSAEEQIEKNFLNNQNLMKERQRGFKEHMQSARNDLESTKQQQAKQNQTTTNTPDPNQGQNTGPA